MKKEVNADVLSGVMGLAIATVFGLAMEDGSWLSTWFPKYLIGLIVVLSTILVIKGWIKPERLPIFNDGDNRRILITAAVLFCWCAAIKFIGLYVSSVVIITFMVWYLAKARRQVTVQAMCIWLLIITIKVGLFYLVFSRLLFVPLIKGALV